MNRISVSTIALFLLSISISLAADAIPATHAGTWRRTEVLDQTGKGSPAGRRYFMIMRPDGQILWTGTKGAPDHAPMNVMIRNGTDIVQKTATGEKTIGKAIVEGDKLKLIFSPVPLQAPSGYVRVSKSIDPKDVEGVKP